MSGKRSHFTSVLKFWRSVETFNLPDVPDPNRVGDKDYFPLEPGGPLPWQEPEYQAAPDGKAWRHTLYFFVVPKESVMGVLEGLVPHSTGEFREPATGNTCLSALVVDEWGRAVKRSYVRSSFAYGMKILREKKSPEDLQGMLEKVYEDYALRFEVRKETGSAQKLDERETGKEGSGEDKGDKAPYESEDAPNDAGKTAPEEEAVYAPLDWTELKSELDDLQTLAGKRLQMDVPIVCISEMVKQGSNPDAPFLNSFYLNDLNTLINNPSDLGQPLATYLTEKVDIQGRFNLLSPGALLSCLDPARQSPGRWPANPAHGLYSAQMAALNLAIPSLHRGSGLWGINGPPGTGKTTLLREIVVDAVVSRARRLMDADVTKLFSTRPTEIEEYSRYHTFDERIFGNEGILVASNNNSAVENISRELPMLKSIDGDAFPDAMYFEEIAENLQKKDSLHKKIPCWGLLSAVLGKAENRYEFSRDFWFDRQNGFDVYLKSFYSDPQKTAEQVELFKEEASELRQLLKQFNVYQQLAREHYSELVKWFEKGRGSARRWEEAAAQLQKKYGIPAANLPGADFLGLPLDVIHKMTPYSSEMVNKLRSSIFIKSLHLHARAILANAKYVRANLAAFIDMLAGKYKEKMDEKVRPVLWGSFFFCIPLVSATLASVERLFTKMGKGSIGWLLLDEAGQATPSSACGALWRAQRCILIGDTLQIPPVVTIPKGLGELLQTQYGILDSAWSPLQRSAQYLADRATPVGTYIDIEGTDVWTGIPLRAHRRCQEPMFSIANQIAYNNQMVKLTVDSEDGARLPQSCWIDVKGTGLLNRHMVAEEITAVQEILAGLIARGHRQDIYIISPFRSVGDYCREKIPFRKQSPVISGTIHTFQGKETEIVLLVLGTEAGNVGARQWASSIPNMLNVAVTRAKRRLYVVGDRKLWGGCRYFDELAKALPVRVYKAGVLVQYF